MADIGTQFEDLTGPNWFDIDLKCADLICPAQLQVHGLLPVIASPGTRIFVNARRQSFRATARGRAFRIFRQ